MTITDDLAPSSAGIQTGSSVNSPQISSLVQSTESARTYSPQYQANGVHVNNHLSQTATLQGAYSMQQSMPARSRALTNPGGRFSNVSRTTDAQINENSFYRKSPTTTTTTTTRITEYERYSASVCCWQFNEQLARHFAINSNSFQCECITEQ